MKKFLCVILTIVMLFCGNTVYASDFQQSTSTLTYTVEDRFFVMIPETIPVGQAVQITAADMNIDPSKRVDVRFFGLEINDGITIASVNDPNSTLVVHFKDENENKFTTSNVVIGSFYGNGSGQSLTLIPYVDDDMGAIAGDYTGTVQFDIVCQ